MRSMRPDKDICVKKIAIPSGRRKIPALVLSPKKAPVRATGVLWLHGGGYILGMKEMVHMSRAVDLVKRFVRWWCRRGTGWRRFRPIRRRRRTAMRRCCT